MAGQYTLFGSQRGTQSIYFRKRNWVVEYLSDLIGTGIHGRQVNWNIKGIFDDPDDNTWRHEKDMDNVIEMQEHYFSIAQHWTKYRQAKEKYDEINLEWQSRIFGNSFPIEIFHDSRHNDYSTKIPDMDFMRTKKADSGRKLFEFDGKVDMTFYAHINDNFDTVWKDEYWYQELSYFENPNEFPKDAD